MSVVRGLHPDTVYLSGTILTMDRANATVEAVATVGEQIVAVGSRLEVVCLVVAALVAGGCSQGVASPTATKAPPAPTKAAEPTRVETTKAPEPTKAAAPAAAPTKAAGAGPAQVDYPAKGKTTTTIVPWGAGGQLDIVARALAALMEKDLGVPIVVVNKARASRQVGLTGMYMSKPDGYTAAYAYHPHTQITYLDPEANAPYGRKDFQLAALVQRSSLAPIADVLAGSIKKAMAAADAMKKLEDAGNEMVYLGPKEYDLYWSEVEEEAIRVVTAVRGQVRKWWRRASVVY